jgi:hypothetical protein
MDTSPIPKVELTTPSEITPGRGSCSVISRGAQGVVGSRPTRYEGSRMRRRKREERDMARECTLRGVLLLYELGASASIAGPGLPFAVTLRLRTLRGPCRSILLATP